MVALLNANTNGSGGDGTATAVRLGILGSERMTATEASGVGGVAGDVHTGAGTGSIIIASYDGSSEMSIAAAMDTQVDDYIQAVDRAIADMTTEE